MMITGRGIDVFRLATMVSGLKLEVLGFKHSRGSCYAMAKREFGLKGNKKSVYDQLFLILERARAGEWPSGYVFKNAEDRKARVQE